MTTEQLASIRHYAQKEMSRSLDPSHDWAHINRVKNNALMIIKRLGLRNDIDINLLQAACFLHDLTYVDRKPTFLTWLLEGKLIKKKVRKILASMDLNPEEKSIIEHAVGNHVHAFPFRRLHTGDDLYSQILQDADSLDEFHEDRMEKMRNGSLTNRLLERLFRHLNRYKRKRIEIFLNFPQLAKRKNE